MTAKVKQLEEEAYILCLQQGYDTVVSEGRQMAAEDFWDEVYSQGLPDEYDESKATSRLHGDKGE